MLNKYRNITANGSIPMFLHGSGIGTLAGTIFSRAIGPSGPVNDLSTANFLVASTLICFATERYLAAENTLFRTPPVLTGLFFAAALMGAAPLLDAAVDRQHAAENGRVTSYSPTP